VTAHPSMGGRLLFWYRLDMGMFSEIAEEMEERALKKGQIEGFIFGVFWPISLPIICLAWAIRPLHAAYVERRSKRAWEKYLRESLTRVPPPPPPLPRTASFNELMRRDGHIQPFQDIEKLAAEEIAEAPADVDVK
jgi:hypothetical protein